MGLSNEFIGRADGWAGLAARYGFSHKPIGLDHGLAYDAIAAKPSSAPREWVPSTITALSAMPPVIDT